MLNAFKRWIGFGDDSPSTADARMRPHGDYRPGLIPALRADHRRLLELFGELERACEQSDELACRSALDRFTRVLQDHLLTENRHLYGYFSRHPESDPSVARQVDGMSADMMHVGKMLHRFITAYTRVSWTGDLFARLRKDLGEVGEVLTHRIHEEESVLYPIYDAHAS